MNWLSVYYPFTTNELFSTYSAIIWTPDTKDWLIGKDRDAGKDWRWEEKGTTEEELVGWHHGLDGHEFEQAPGVGDGQGSLVCCSPWGRKEYDSTEWLNWTAIMDWTPSFSSLHWMWYTFVSRGRYRDTAGERLGFSSRVWLLPFVFSGTSLVAQMVVCL